MIETDYLVVGAGASGMSFVDTLLEHSDADVVMIDRRHRPGGHWLDSYPFVQLHQPSRYYGVSSTPLGRDRVGVGGSEDGLFERATGTEICDYYDEIMRWRFQASGRVRFFPMSEYFGDRRFRSRLTGDVAEVTVRTRVVDATYMATRVPATDPPPFAVDDDIRCVPVGDLARVDEPPAGYVIVGGGKTALDAVCWLLDRGTGPDAITWIRPRDSWILNRAAFQPGSLRTFEGVVVQLEAMGAAADVQEVYEREEDAGVVFRVDRSVVPTMMKGATISVGELEQVRRATNVVRLGHVRRIGSAEIVLEHGTVPTTPGHLHVHCATAGLRDNPPRAIFGDHTITLQPVTRMSLALSAGLIGVVEASGRTTTEKNRLCLPTAWPDTPFDYLRAIMAGIRTEMAWSDAPDLQAWRDASRLDLLHGLAEGADPAELAALQGRFFAALGPAFDQLTRFAAQATPRERARMFDPAAEAG